MMVYMLWLLLDQRNGRNSGNSGKAEHQYTSSLPRGLHTVNDCAKEEKETFFWSPCPRNWQFVGNVGFVLLHFPQNVAKRLQR